jgi:succinate dehydrogenase/fumarate reductase-like Fe-S protein
MNIDGTNTLACTKAIGDCEKTEVPVYPLPHMQVVKDLVPDLTHFYAQYASIKPWMRTQSAPPPDGERLQSKEDRAKLDVGTGVAPRRRQRGGEEPVHGFRQRRKFIAREAGER